jgi:fumarate hydratase subunit alpha
LLNGDRLVEFSYAELVLAVTRTLVEASTTYRPDQLRRFRVAQVEERNEQGRWVIDKLIENALAAEEHGVPLCDDTGIPHICLEVGDEATLPAGFLAAIDEGVAQGLRTLPGRPMAVCGGDVQRITQSAGLESDAAALLAAPVQVCRIPGKQIRLTVLMLGGGPEIRGKTQRIFHHHSLDTVLDEMVAWALDGVAKLGCLPGVLFYGIGRTNLEAASLALQAMKDCDFTKQNEMEARITERVNQSNIGPLGLGGGTTVLGTFIKVGPQRASGVRIVSLRVGCSMDPRKATYTWPGAT